MKLKQYLLLERSLVNGDKRTLQKYIKNPPRKTDSIVLDSFSGNYDESEREVTIYPGKRNVHVSFEYNADFDALTVALVDMIDDMDKYDFRSGVERQTNTQWIEVVKK